MPRRRWLTGADVAVVGEKGWEQRAIARRMVRDLNVPAHMVGRPTTREEVGLAMLSRNVYLTPKESGVPSRSHAAQVAPCEVVAGDKTDVRSSGGTCPAGGGSGRPAAMWSIWRCTPRIAGAARRRGQPGAHGLSVRLGNAWPIDKYPAQSLAATHACCRRKGRAP